MNPKYWHINNTQNNETKMVILYNDVYHYSCLKELPLTNNIRTKYIEMKINWIHGVLESKNIEMGSRSQRREVQLSVIQDTKP